MNENSSRAKALNGRVDSKITGTWFDSRKKYTFSKLDSYHYLQ